MESFHTKQLEQLAIRPDEIWQGAIVEIPRTVREGENVYRPVGPLWRSLETGKVYGGGMDHPSKVTPLALWKSFVNFALDASIGGYLPGCVEVKNDDDARMLRQHLSNFPVEVRVVPALPAIDEVVVDMIENFAESSDHNGLSILDGKGVTLEQVKWFANVAATFFAAAPWRQLCGEDIIRVESPVAPMGMEYLVVLGASGQATGLGFHGSRDEHAKINNGVTPVASLKIMGGIMWSVLFDDVKGIPPSDAGLWKKHQLRLAADDAYPFPAGFILVDESVMRPDAAILGFMGTMLQALALTTEDEIDSGRWTKQVETISGPIQVTLSLPDILEPPTHQDCIKSGVVPDRRAMERVHAQMGRFMAIHKPANIEAANRLIEKQFMGKAPDSSIAPPQTARERAQELCYDAFEATGRRRLQLARRALVEDPNCADAYVILAERASDTQSALSLYQRGVEAGLRSLGADRLVRDKGHFWGILDTRPFMRAKFGMVRSLLELGDETSLREAVEHMSHLLSLNPNDNLGVRYYYPAALMRLGRDSEAAKFMAQHGEEATAAWTYTRALLAFRLGGDCDTSRRELKKAMEVNRYFPQVLIVPPQELPHPPSSYAPGSLEEALVCLDEMGSLVAQTPGALKWIHTRSSGPPKPGGPPKPKERKRPRR